MSINEIIESLSKEERDEVLKRLEGGASEAVLELAAAKAVLDVRREKAEKETASLVEEYARLSKTPSKNLARLEAIGKRLEELYGADDIHIPRFIHR